MNNENSIRVIIIEKSRYNDEVQEYNHLCSYEAANVNSHILIYIHILPYFTICGHKTGKYKNLHCPFLFLYCEGTVVTHARLAI